jgi:hypothetical protein
MPSSPKSASPRARRSILVTCLGLAVSVFASMAHAHHSFGMFDMTKEQTLTGTVTNFEWTNPHTWIWIEVATSSGGTDRWGIEGMSPNFLERRGWTKGSVKPGDKVSIVIHPVRDGRKGGSFVSITLPDGTVMSMGGPPPPQTQH